MGSIHRVETTKAGHHLGNLLNRVILDSFTDVLPSKWYAEVIQIGNYNGIVLGKSNIKFDPDAPITREEMAAMLLRAYEHERGRTRSQHSLSFTDQELISIWAVNEVSQAVQLQLNQGRPANKFDPHALATRAEAAQAVYNLMHQLEK